VFEVRLDGETKNISTFFHPLFIFGFLTDNMERKNDFKYQSDLILKYLTDSLTAEEQENFDLWLNESQGNRDLVESFRDTKKIQPEINALSAFDTEDAWKNISHQLGQKPVQLFAFKNIIKYGAAAVLITFALGTYWYTNKVQEIAPSKVATVYNIPAGKKRAAFELPNGETISLTDANVALKPSAITAKDGTLYFTKTASNEGNNVLRTPKAGEYKMILPDGTNVWLNASSSLSFANSFNKNERKVYLKGEAYFEVAHNLKKPFIVSFNKTEVEVLGTHFNINTYDKESKTTLLEGAVRITDGGIQKLLKPGEEATITTKGIDITKVETYKTVAWKEGLFLFEEENMTDILDQVARWYDVQIKYDGKPNAKKYSGNIRRQANLNQVLEMLTTVSGNSFTLTNRTITVKF
jgi:transmembrane sensor